MSLPTQLNKTKGDYLSLLDEFSEELVAKGEMDLATYITEKMSEGKSIKRICSDLEFPKVQMMAWLKVKHPQLLAAARDVNADAAMRDVQQEVEYYDDSNYKYLSAKHKMTIDAIKQDRDRTVDTGTDGNTGMSFSINVVMPEYVEQEKVKQVNAVPEIVIEEK